ncbi:class I SAM-dependent methyltransferase, partial [Gemmatimonadota bacterium]
KAFSHAYLNVYSHRDENEAARAVNLIRKAIQPLLQEYEKAAVKILDLCCGQGRYSMLLAEEGYNVVGLDLSKDLLAVADQRWKVAGASGADNSGRLRLVRADMRRIPFVDAFHVMINMFTSFGYFDRDSDNQAVLDTSARALHNRGRFMIDYLNRDQVLKNLVGEDDSEIEGLTLRQSRRISQDGLRVEKNVQVTGPEGEDSYNESVRLYSLSEMETMLDHSGFSLEEVFGDYDCSAWSAESPRLIMIGSKNG